MLRLFGIQNKPVIGILLGLAGIVIGVASDRTLIAVIGVVILVVSGIRGLAARGRDR